jgi:hypothetical protein|tara:strand:- start:116 stop:388 length:273 start_codon:yes stop_codon:yes gene_type:complete
MGFLFGKTAMGTYVVVAFWVACYYFFSGMFPTWHFAAGSMPGLAGWPVALLIGFLLVVANMISVYLFIKVAGNRPWEWFEDGTYGPGDEG